jgi:hypothetical protein
MSYLRFLHELVESDKDNMQMLLNVLILSLGEQYNYFINIDEKDKAKLILKRNKDNKNIVPGGKMETKKCTVIIFLILLKPIFSS